jgi:hypothetical protein
VGGVGCCLVLCVFFLDDFVDGGLGCESAVVDGVVDEVFPDVGELDFGDDVFVEYAVFFEEGVFEFVAFEDDHGGEAVGVVEGDEEVEEAEVAEAFVEFADEAAGGVFAECGFGVDHCVDDAGDLFWGECVWWLFHGCPCYLVWRMVCWAVILCLVTHEWSSMLVCARSLGVEPRWWSRYSVMAL